MFLLSLFCPHPIKILNGGKLSRLGCVGWCSFSLNCNGNGSQVPVPLHYHIRQRLHSLLQPPSILTGAGESTWHREGVYALAQWPPCQLDPWEGQSLSQLWIWDSFMLQRRHQVPSPHLHWEKIHPETLSFLLDWGWKPVSENLFRFWSRSGKWVGPWGGHTIPDSTMTWHRDLGQGQKSETTIDNRLLLNVIFNFQIVKSPSDCK